MSGVQTVLDTPPSRKSAFVHSPMSAEKPIRVIAWPGAGRPCPLDRELHVLRRAEMALHAPREPFDRWPPALERRVARGQRLRGAL